MIYSMPPNQSPKHKSILAAHSISSTRPILESFLPCQAVATTISHKKKSDNNNNNNKKYETEIFNYILTVVGDFIELTECWLNFSAKENFMPNLWVCGIPNQSLT